MDKDLHDLLIKRVGEIYTGEPVLKLPSESAKKDKLLQLISTEKYPSRNFFEYYKKEIISEILYNDKDELDLRCIREGLERKSRKENYSFSQKEFLQAANCVWYSYFHKSRKQPTSL